MPPPPPPPGPPPPGPPPPPVFGGASKSKGSTDDRNALLSSIRQGAKLKKTVTVDKSGPYIPGKVSNAPSGGSPVGNGVKSSSTIQNGGGCPPGLGGLFAGGMPKLRPTGKLAGPTPNGQVKQDAPRNPPPQTHTQRSSPDKSRTPSSAGNVSALSAAISEALAGRDRDMARDTRDARETREVPSVPTNPPPSRPAVRRQPSEVKRGPPPQPPAQKPGVPLSSSDSVLTGGSLSDRISSLQAAGGGGGEAPPSHATLQRNKSALHSTQGALGGSMTSLTSAPPTPTPASSLSTSDLSERPRVSHGKPNLAPKPPSLGAAPTTDTRPSPPPKKLIMNGKIASRTQSMRVPRSPPVSPPSPSGGGGARPAQPPPAPYNPPIGTKNPASHFGTLRAPRGLRPPGVCPPPPPGAPPPPPARHASLAAPPPPPPHFRQQSTVSTDEVCAPAPPVRGSSMRAELEARFSELFNPVTSFPPPDAFLRKAKGYSSTTQSAKAQAPLPPLQVPLDGWSGTSSAC